MSEVLQRPHFLTDGREAAENYVILSSTLRKKIKKGSPRYMEKSLADVKILNLPALGIMVQNVIRYLV